MFNWLKKKKKEEESPAAEEILLREGAEKASAETENAVEPPAGLETAAESESLEPLASEEPPPAFPGLSPEPGGASSVPAETAPATPEHPAEKHGFFGRLKDRLSATRQALAGRLEALLASARTIDDDLLDELEEVLITADLGAKTAQDLLQTIRRQVARKELKDAEALKAALKTRLTDMVSLPPFTRPEAASPVVLMVVGINGVGKTTTIAKLARRFQEEGRKVLLAAGDTFRAAAVEQLTIWAQRLDVGIVSQPTGADPSAVVFDALTAARARGTDVVIIDTAGRLHTKTNLMDELKKIKRVAGKALPGAPHEIILVLDANTGQNALRQAQIFKESVGVDSLIMTKLDGTAKGGVIVAIANELKIPVSYIGLGESFEDLRPFDPRAFSEAILDE